MHINSIIIIDTSITHNNNVHKSQILHPLAVYTTVDYEYRHENKGTDLGLVPRKCGCI